ncbi:MAG TPA: DUF5317 family protein [Microthrixaceae bacterium]|nr:DUF5317 family protein [Microthrixaceae bacterium]
MLAVLPTVLAVVGGIALGLSGGGRFDNLLRWRPAAWQLGVGAIAVQLLFRLFPVSGWFAVLIDVCSTAALVAFAVLNVRIGGMIVIVVGLCMNLVPMVLNWGTPVSGDAMVSAGLVEEEDLARVELEGSRHLAEDETLGWLGDVIPLPTGQVISLGDIVVLVGVALTLSSLLRGRRVGATRAPAPRPARRPTAPRPTPRTAPPARKPRPPAASRPSASRSSGSRSSAPSAPPASTRRPAPAAPPPQRRPSAPPPPAPEPRRTRRGTPDQPRIPYDEAVQGLSGSTGSTRSRRRRAREAEDEVEVELDEVDLRDAPADPPYRG